ncbi:J domain-containing protein [Halobacteriaceae archaeon SHR40]|uniref:J domain-containing protein n=1 Tax=Halovenus amylolytica TaxID=2500550 RepID=UPI000FE3BC86
MTETYYQRLGVSQNADQAAIKQVWQEAVKENHPDQNDDPDAQQQFIQIKEAYDVLSDSDKRAHYDEIGHEEFVDDRQRNTSQDSQEAYQRDRTQRDSAQSSQNGQTTWSANTRGHEAAEHVWTPGSGPTADTAPPTGTADASFGKRAVAYGALVLIPAMLSVVLFTSVTDGIPQYGIKGGISAGAIGVVALAVGIVYGLLLVPSGC